MPLVKSDVFERYPAISLRKWEEDTSKTLTFLEEDKDVNTPNGLMYLAKVREGKETKELWIKPNSALAIGLAPHVPFKMKTLKITKTGSGLKDTRYNAEEVKNK